MSASGWKQALADLKEELAQIHDDSKRITRQLERSTKDAECCKIEFLQGYLDEQCRAVARQRGWQSVVRDKRILGPSLAVSAAAAILGGLVTKDKYAAMNAGLSTLNSTLRRLGSTRWAVSLGSNMVVTAWDAIPPNGKWVTLESLKLALQCLKAEASQGKELGTLDDVINLAQVR